MPFSALPPKALAQVAAVTDGAVRIGPLLGIPALLRELGQDPAAVFDQAGVDPRLFDNPENVIRFPALGLLLARCAAVSGCDHFGLRLGERTGLESLGLVGVLMEHSADVGKALQNLILHLHLHDRGAVPGLAIEGDRVALSYTVYQPGVEGTRHIHDLAAAIALNVMKALCGRDWWPSQVNFSHSRPADPEPYRRYFRCPLRFDSERMAMSFPSRCLGQVLAGADAKLSRLLEARIAELESIEPGDLVDQVRRVLRNLLLGGKGPIDAVADIFGIHPRTLNRRLRARGLTFQGLVEEVRFDIARQLLSETDLAIVAIAAVLDYADAAAFTRAFRRWSGTTPAVWRRDRPRG